MTTRPTAGAVYRSDVLVRFAHCDPAGIVFYPHYLVMVNNLVEDWCRDELRCGFPELHGRLGLGLPTVRLEVDFVTPGRLGERLAAELVVQGVGRSSMRLGVRLLSEEGRDRLRAVVVLVLMNLATHRPEPLPPPLRAEIERFVAAP